jgi:hypothetical protein
MLYILSYNLCNVELTGIAIMYFVQMYFSTLVDSLIFKDNQMPVI